LLATIDVLVRCQMMHKSACRNFRFLGYLVPVILLEVGVLMVLLKPGSSALTTAGLVGMMLAARVVLGVCIGVQVLVAGRGGE